MRAFKFGKPKNPGFGISRDFYLSVLSSKAVLPTMLSVLNPKGEGGAIEGFGAPLSPDASKDSLHQPLERGSYVLASKDRKTVLKMLVLSKEEAGFDPSNFPRSSLALDANPELLARILATWSLIQLTFESHDAMVYPAIDFLLNVAERLAVLCEGVVADPIAQRYALPGEVRHLPAADPKIDARDLVNVRVKDRPDGLYLYTAGMRKFDLRELELPNVEPVAEAIGKTLLLSACQTALLGTKIEPGDRFGAVEMPFEAREGGFDRALWEGIPCYELLPPTRHTTTEALQAFGEALRQ